MRLQGLDIARFLAFCGMVLVNFRIAAGVTPTGDWVSLFTNALEGRAAALFVVLAGISISLGNPGRAVLLRRALFLLVIGMANQLIFEADILHFYGLYFLCALPFLAVSDRALLWGAVGTVLLALITQIGLDYEANWNWETLEYADFWTIGGFLRHSFLNGWHPVFPWFAFLLMGIWIGRRRLDASHVQAQLMLWGVLAAVLGVLPVQFTTPGSDLEALLGTAAIPPSLFYMIAASGSACAVIGLLLKVTPMLERISLATWLAQPGRMALTLYVAHILIGMGALEEMGLLDGSLATHEIFAASLTFCALAALFSWIWLVFLRRGPLEELMRRITG